MSRYLRWACTACVLVFVVFDAVAQQAVRFSDSRLEEKIRSAAGRPAGNILDAHLAALTELDVSDGAITRLDGLESCVNLMKLDLSGNSVSDLSPISNLLRLTWLDLDGNSIVTLDPLGNLKALEYVFLSGNRIRAVGPLGGLTALRQLFLRDNQINRIEPLSGLAQSANLCTLDLAGNSIREMGRYGFSVGARGRRAVLVFSPEP